MSLSIEDQNTLNQTLKRVRLMFFLSFRLLLNLNWPVKTLFKKHFDLCMALLMTEHGGEQRALGRDSILFNVYWVLLKIFVRVACVMCGAAQTSTETLVTTYGCFEISSLLFTGGNITLCGLMSTVNICTMLTSRFWKIIPIICCYFWGLEYTITDECWNLAHKAKQIEEKPQNFQGNVVLDCVENAYVEVNIM